MLVVVCCVVLFLAREGLVLGLWLVVSERLGDLPMCRYNIEKENLL